MKRRRRKTHFISFARLATVVLIFTVVAGGFVAWKYLAPSKEQADIQEIFAVSSQDEVAIIWNGQRTDGIKGKIIEDAVYLPQDWVSNSINERFYWDEADKQLIYTFPESILYIGEDDRSEDGKPLFVEADDQVWVLADLVQEHTDIRTETFVDGEANRFFLDSNWDTEQTAVLKKKTAVRIRGGVKSKIVAQEAKGTQVTILDEMEKWSRVRTEDGYLGYIKNSTLKDRSEEQPISHFEEPVYTNISLDEPITLVWHQVTTKDANQTMEKLMANTKGVNVIAPTWFLLTDNQGNYECLADRSYVQKAHAMGAQVWAVLDNFNKGDNVDSGVLFSDTSARKKLIAGLIGDVQTYGIDGINLDIEGIKSSVGPHYVEFIRELSVDCRKNGIILSVDTYVPSAYTAFYNRAEQGRVADYVVIMGYDEHYAGGDAGSVASLGYEKQGIEDALREVPKEKLISAIPFYTRVWQEDANGVTSQAMGITKAKQWVQDNQVELTWEDALGQYYGEKTENGTTYSIWMEEERSIGLKMDLIRSNNLAGVACWKLGFEPSDIWDIVKLP
ncbi:glycosyl hydrolase family 18 protein [Brotaphodocola sp.]|uniref:glycosyl hydrolase family 18 protein n=1 Tax=Brotaphodocola sp. TaxID=3073577 RepID=UPI003D7C96EF